MPFFIVKRRVIHWLRLICGSLSMVIVVATLLPSAQWLNKLGAFYLSQRDQHWAALAEQGDAAAWQSFLELGDISRHHRAAPYKTQLWHNILANEAQLPSALQKSINQWAKKNERRIDIQLQLARHYFLQGKTKKALALITPIAYQFPTHTELSKRYASWLEATQPAAIAQQLMAEHSNRQHNAQQRETQPIQVLANQTTTGLSMENRQYALLSAKDYRQLTQHLEQ